MDSPSGLRYARTPSPVSNHEDEVIEQEGVITPMVCPAATPQLSFEAVVHSLFNQATVRVTPERLSTLQEEWLTQLMQANDDVGLALLHLLKCKYELPYDAGEPSEGLQLNDQLMDLPIEMIDDYDGRPREDGGVVKSFW